MTVKQFALRLTMTGFVGFGAVNMSGCSSSSGGSSPSPAPATPTSLSTAFATNCAISGCHGSAGTATPTGGTANGILKGTKIGSAAAYINYVRSPTNKVMPPFDTTKISDTDLTSDYNYLTK